MKAGGAEDVRPILNGDNAGLADRRLKAAVTRDQKTALTLASCLNAKSPKHSPSSATLPPIDAGYEPLTDVNDSSMTSHAVPESPRCSPTSHHY
jgi:hypothetical protein